MVAQVDHTFLKKLQGSADNLIPHFGRQRLEKFAIGGAASCGMFAVECAQSQNQQIERKEKQRAKHKFARFGPSLH